MAQQMIGFVDIADFAGELPKLQETVAHKISCAFDPLMISADRRFRWAFDQ
jgi:hypothetical protein